MAKLTGGQAAVAALQNEKVSHVFGLIGSATMETVSYTHLTLPTIYSV